MCRGIFFVIENNQVVLIARPFNKFFNLNEHDRLFPEEFKVIMSRITGPVQAYDKLDGDIIKMFYFEGKLYFGTNTVPFKKPKEIDTFFDQNDINFDDFCSNLDPKYTYLLERTAPMSHITFYQQVSFTLIGVIHTQTGEEIDIQTYGTSFHGIPVVQCTEFPTIADVISAANDANRLPCHPGYEGHVVTLPIRDIHGALVRFKIKNDNYLKSKTLNVSNIMYAGILARLVEVLNGAVGAETKLGSPKPKDFADYKEAVSYIPQIATDVDTTRDSIMSELKELVDNIPTIRPLTGKDRYNALRKFTIVGTIANRLISVPSETVSVEFALQMLMNENKSETRLKKMLKSNVTF